MWLSVYRGSSCVHFGGKSHPIASYSKLWPLHNSFQIYSICLVNEKKCEWKWSKYHSPGHILMSYVTTKLYWFACLTLVLVHLSLVLVCLFNSCTGSPVLHVQISRSSTSNRRVSTKYLFPDRQVNKLFQTRKEIYHRCSIWEIS